MIFTTVLTGLLPVTLAAVTGEQYKFTAESKDDAYPNYMPGDGGTQADSVFSGISTFGKIDYEKCLSDESISFDIAFIGAPFDTATSYRPGARFGPSGIRQGSRRLNLYGGYNVPLDTNPFNSWAKMIDCGDIPVTSYDNAVAIQQIESGHKDLLHRKVKSGGHETVSFAKDGKVHPRLITLGGDHTIVLPLLRSINSVYGPVKVIHFDSHLDTWKPSVFGGSPSQQASINHGTYFWHAANEGLVSNSSNIHCGIRTTLSGPSDYDNDGNCGFTIVEAREIDRIGTQGIIDKIWEVVGDGPVYLSIDIDVLDPAFAPATGTPETGGWSTRELRTILRGLDGMKIVAADLVEVATPYDTNAELTTMAAADVLYEVISVMTKTPLWSGKKKQPASEDSRMKVGL